MWVNGDSTHAVIRLGYRGAGSRSTAMFPSGQNAMIAIRGNLDRGKSELHRADRQVTPGRREATDRATESKPPMTRGRELEGTGKGEMVE